MRYLAWQRGECRRGESCTVDDLRAEVEGIERDRELAKMDEKRIGDDDWS